MEKTGHIESGTLEHFSNYKYAPSRPSTIDVFGLTSAAFAGFGATNNSRPSTKTNMKSFRMTNSAESEITTDASLTNPSVHDSFDHQLPKAEE